jgi:subtilisin family serine protease
LTAVALVVPWLLAGAALPVRGAPAEECGYLVEPREVLVPSGGGHGWFRVTAGEGCPWTAAEELDWLTIISARSGSGAGTVHYRVDPDPGLPRRGSVSLGGTLFTVSQDGTGTYPADVLGNGDFEEGRQGWSEGGGGGRPLMVADPARAHGGTWLARLGGGNRSTEYLFREVGIPADAVAADLSFWYRVETGEEGPTPYDTLTAVLYRPADGSLLRQMVTLSNADAGGWREAAGLDLLGHRGETVLLGFEVRTDGILPTGFDLDDVALLVSRPVAESLGIPGDPQGPTTLSPGQTGNFRTGRASSSAGHPVEYRFEWGDGGFSPWLAAAEADHAWGEAGPRLVRVQARCATHPAVLSGWSPVLEVTVDPEAETVQLPLPPTGPSEAAAGSLQVWTAGGSGSSLEHPLQYRLDWGDGTGTVWLDAAAGVDQRRPKTLPADLAELRRRAPGGERQRVVVGLGAPFRAEGYLDAAALRSQRTGYGALQEEVLRELGDLISGPVHRSRHAPLLALAVDARGLRRLAAHPAVARIWPDEEHRPLLEQSVPLVGAPAAWEGGYSGAGQVVAVLDTGVWSAHSFLQGKVVAEACYSSSDTGFVTTCPDGTSQQTGPGAAAPCPLSICSHGTHVAGIAAGRGSSFSGVARDASLIAVQVFSRRSDNSTVSAFTSDILRGLEHVYELRDSFQIAAVNLSLGSGSYAAPCDDDSPLTYAVGNLRSVGIATVAASGNNGALFRLDHPACISTVISVGSTTKGDQVSSFSNAAPFLTLLAPGSSILSSVPGGGWDVKSGTSMATPHVAGAWAVLKSRNPAATVEQVAGALVDTGRPVADGRGNGLVTPRIQVDLAVEALAAGEANPLPVLTSLSPAAAAAGGPGFTLTLDGSGFLEGTLLLWDGDPRTPTALGPNRLSARVGPEDLLLPGAVPVAVWNPPPGGGSSNTALFTVTGAGGENTASAGHLYAGAGTYLLRARARCALHPEVASGWSPPLAVAVAGTGEETVAAPASPEGPTAGTVETSLPFTTGGASSSLGDPLQHRFDWGDGTRSEWREGTDAAHAWGAPGTYHLRAQARCALHGVESPWSASPAVTITGCPQRVVEVAGAPGAPGGKVTVGIELVSRGDENSLTFSLEHDPEALVLSGARLGADALGARLTVNDTLAAEGMAGFAVTMEGGGTFPAGRRRLVEVDLDLSPAAAAGSLPLRLADRPVAREITDASLDPLGACWRHGEVTVRHLWEGDVAPRPHGNGAFTAADREGCGRFAVGLDLPEDPGEFQRADTAPAAEGGDGLLGAADWVECGRYAAELDRRQVARGPTAPLAGARPGQASAPTSTLRMPTISGEPGGRIVLPVELVSLGEENALTFTVVFDPAVLSLVSAGPGTGAGGALLLVNAAEATAGRVGVGLAMGAGERFPAGTLQLLELVLDLAGSAPTGTSPVSFGDRPALCQVAGPDAVPLPVIRWGGGVTVVPPPVGELGEALDEGLLPWTTTGDAPWFRQEEVWRRDGDAARSGAVGHGQSSWLSAPITGPACVSFWWRCSSQAGRDGLVFLTDGVNAHASLSGQRDWRQLRVALPPGGHTLDWVWVKDGSGSQGEDAGWVDGVTLGEAARALTVHAPGNGWVLRRGRAYPLVWASCGSIPAVSIRLFRGEREVARIAARTPDDGRFLWRIPRNLRAGKTYWISLRAVNDPGVGARSYGFFTIAP